MFEEYKFLTPDKMKHPTRNIELEYLKKNDATCFVLFNETKERAILVQQFRPGVNDLTYELPAGLIEKNENIELSAFRELREETGYAKEDVTELTCIEHGILPTPAYSTEKMYFFSARLKSDDIKPRELILDEGEDIETKWVNVNDILTESNDMKTILGILYFLKK